MRSLLQQYLYAMAWVRWGGRHFVDAGRPSIVGRLTGISIDGRPTPCNCWFFVGRGLSIGLSMDDLHCRVLKSSLILKLDRVILIDFCSSFVAVTYTRKSIFSLEVFFQNAKMSLHSGTEEGVGLMSGRHWRFGDDCNLLHDGMLKTIHDGTEEGVGIMTLHAK